MAFDGTAVAGVVDLTEYRNNMRTWTKGEKGDIEGKLLRALQGRMSTYAVHYYETEEGEPVLSLVPREDREATHTITKDGREYVLLDESGRLWKRSADLSEIIGAALVP